MDHVSRPLLVALVAAVAFLGVWMVALKPHNSNGGTASTPAAASAHPVTPHQPARTPRPAARPHAASKQARHAAAAPRVVHRAPSGPRPAVSATGRLGAVERAMATRKVLALLFYNPSAADDQAVKQELATVPAHGGQVFKLAIPLSELSNYAVLTNRVPVNISPTLVIVDRTHHAEEITGFADSFEISQRLQEALGVRAARP